MAVDFELRPDRRGRVVYRRLADHVLQTFVLGGFRAVVFGGSVAAVLGGLDRLRIFLVRVVLLGAARLLYGLAKLLVGPARPGVRRFLLPVLPLARLAAVPRVAATAPRGGVRDLHQTSGAAREDAGHFFGRFGRAATGSAGGSGSEAGSSGGDAGLPGGPARGWRSRGRLRGCCASPRAQVASRSRSDRVCSKKLVPLCSGL